MARAEDWADRARAGRELVQHIGIPEADTLLRELLLDRADSAVIAQTAASLLDRGDTPAWRIFVGAWNLANPSQSDQLVGALSGALFAASLSPENSAALRNTVATLIADGDENVRGGAERLRARVAAALPD